jgi:hypothetical protein
VEAGRGKPSRTELSRVGPIAVTRTSFVVAALWFAVRPTRYFISCHVRSSSAGRYFAWAKCPRGDLNLARKLLRLVPQIGSQRCVESLAAAFLQRLPWRRVASRGQVVRRPRADV